MGFPSRLKEARKAAGLTQKQVAEALGVSVSTYCGYESGYREPFVPKIKKLASILGVSGDWLIESGFDEHPLVSEQEPLTGKDVYDWLRSSGFIENDEDLSDADLRFLSSILLAVDNWFNKE